MWMVMANALTTNALKTLCVIVVSVALLWNAVPAAGDSPLIDRDAPQCGTYGGYNISGGVPAGASRFSVTAQDCCAYCSSVSGCTGAVYASYYCHPMVGGELEPSEASVTTLLLSTPAPTSTTTVAPTPVPTTPTPAPQRFGEIALLISCSGSIYCDTSIYQCDTLAVPLGVCASVTDYSPKTTTAAPSSSSGSDSYSSSTSTSSSSLAPSGAAPYLSVANTSQGLLMTFYSDASCGAESYVSQQLYPWECQYDSAMSAGIRASLIAWEAEPGTQQVTAENCGSTPYCTACQVTFEGLTGTCVPVEPTPPGQKQLYQQRLCLGSLMVTFAYGSLAECEMNAAVLGTALPTGVCYQFVSTNTMYRNTCANV
jgi:hypothetical protein